MRRITSLIFALAFVVSVSFGQVATAARRSHPETEPERAARFTSHQRQEAMVQDLSRKAHAAALTAPAPESINIPCTEAILISNSAFSILQTACGSGGTVFVGTFRAFLNGDYATAIAPFGPYLFALTGYGKINVFTDTLRRGIADATYAQPAVGIANSARIIPVSLNEVYTENSREGELFQYTLSGNKATSQGNNLPQLGQTANGTTLYGNNLYSIVQETDSVVTTPFNDSTLQTLYSGHNVSAITIDPTGNLFIEEAGDYCNNQPVPGDGTGPVQACLAPQISMRAPNGTVTVLPYSPLLSVFYSFENVLYAAADGSLYATSFQQNPDGTSSQVILQYRYKTTGGITTFAPPTVFVTAQQLGQYGWVNAITSFGGGPIQ